MSAADLRREEEALAWVRRIADPGFAEWEMHAAWLESDPANPAAFDRALLLIEDATAGLEPYAGTVVRGLATAANDNPVDPARHWRRLVAGAGAVAAGVAALFALQPSGSGGTARFAITTGAGAPRNETLADGSHVALNGATRLELDRADPHKVRLVRGEAFFSVRHDAQHPFTLLAGDVTFRDVGTAFNVRQLPGSTEIAVREGVVLFDPEHAAVRLDKGQAMTVSGGTATVRQIDPASAGSWRAGRLVYRNAPLAVVAGDIERATGLSVSVDKSLADRHFSGVIILDGDRQRMFERIGAVMGVVMQRDGQGWRLGLPAG